MWAKVSEVKAGDVLIADGGFVIDTDEDMPHFCLANGEHCLVQEENGHLFVKCQSGEHYLNGQIDEGDEYIGFTKFTGNTLPEKLSACIVVAVADLIKVEAKPETYTVDMGLWHEPNTKTNKCQVCLAGSVMAMTLGDDPEDDTVPSSKDNYLYRRLQALNMIREGSVSGALYDVMNRHIAWADENIVSYGKDPVLFKHQFLDLAHRLAQAGY